MNKSFKKHQLKYRINKNRRLIGGAKISLKKNRSKLLRKKSKNLRKKKRNRKRNLRNSKKRKNMKGGFSPFSKNKDRVLIDAMCSQLDEEFVNNPRRIDGYINSLCAQKTGVIGGALNMVNPMNNGVFDFAKKAFNVATSPVRKIVKGVTNSVSQNPPALHPQLITNAQQAMPMNVQQAMPVNGQPMPVHGGQVMQYPALQSLGTNKLNIHSKINKPQLQKNQFKPKLKKKIVSQKIELK